MNFRRAIRREEPEINFIPLIDLLLVILIFLMVTTTYARFRDLNLNLPTADDPNQEQRPDIVNVAVTQDGRYALGNTPPVKQDAASLSGALRSAATGMKSPIVAIHADAGATHQNVVEVLEAARLAGIPRVTFAAQAP